MNKRRVVAGIILSIGFFAQIHSGHAQSGDSALRHMADLTRDQYMVAL